jgi:hypothetical protein
MEHLDAGRGRRAGKRSAGELAGFVGVENFRLAEWANASSGADTQDDWSADSARTPRYRSGASSGVPAGG